MSQSSVVIAKALPPYEGAGVGIMVQRDRINQ